MGVICDQTKNNKKGIIKGKKGGNLGEFTIEKDSEENVSIEKKSEEEDSKGCVTKEEFNQITNDLIKKNDLLIHQLNQFQNEYNQNQIAMQCNYSNQGMNLVGGNCSNQYITFDYEDKSYKVFYSGLEKTSEIIDILLLQIKESIKNLTFLNNGLLVNDQFTNDNDITSLRINGPILIQKINLNE